MIIFILFLIFPTDLRRSIKKRNSHQTNYNLVANYNYNNLCYEFMYQFVLENNSFGSMWVVILSHDTLIHNEKIRGWQKHGDYESIFVDDC